MITLITASALAVSVDEAKEYGRIDGSDEDGVVESLVRVSQDLVEDYTGQAASLATYQWSAEAWPSWQVDNYYRFPAFVRPKRREIVLGRSPLVSVESFKYINPEGQLVTIDPSSYSVDTFNLPGRVVLKEEFSLLDLDTTSNRPDVVAIEFKAGVSNSILNQAIKMMFVNLYENRSPVVTGTIATELPMSIKHLLRSQRVETPFSS